VAALAVLSFAGCQSQPEAREDEAPTEDEPSSATTGTPDKLADPTGSESSDQKARDRAPVYELSSPPEELARTLDASFDDWDAPPRELHGGSAVDTGARFRDGGSDASFATATHSDGGHFYLAVEIRDDTVIDAGSKKPFPDGFVVWLRDPGLAQLRRRLPDAWTGRRRIQPQIGILFTPDGQFWARSSDRTQTDLYRRAVDAAATHTDRGWRVEVALEVSVLRDVSRLPLETVELRYELLDGDTPDRRGVQTRLSHPEKSDDEWSYERHELGGWLPYDEARGVPGPARLGRWQHRDRTWQWRSFEYRPEGWHRLDDLSPVESALSQDEAFTERCNRARRAVRVVAAWGSRDRNVLAALALCAPRASGDCPADAQAHLYLVKLAKNDGTWSSDAIAAAAPEPLPRCADAPAPRKPYTKSFSLLPLGMLDASLWAVGWHRRDERPGYLETASGVWFVRPGGSPSTVGRATTGFNRASTRDRTVGESEVYLTPVDDRPGVDICGVTIGANRPAEA
ncbi:MAG: hypothetical protein ABEL76_13690, partial [Bradymonadaceae bacterium]